MVSPRLRVFLQLNAQQVNTLSFSETLHSSQADQIKTLLALIEVLLKAHKRFPYAIGSPKVGERICNCVVVLELQ